MVGFLDEHRLIVGTHSGIGIIDSSSGDQIDRASDPEGTYEWFSEPPPSATYVGVDRTYTVPVAGLWGGGLRETTADGWRCLRTPEGATLSGPDGTTVLVEDDEEFRAVGFSPEGRVFVYATSPTLYLVVR